MHVTLLTPLYNEEEAIKLFWQQTQEEIAKVPFVQFSYLFVNDGSKDGSLAWLKELAAQHPQVRVVSLSRNFGKEAAVTAGLAELPPDADAVIIMDADLQDPVCLITQFVEKFKDGVEMVYGTRNDRQSDGWLKRTTAGLFYKIYNWLSPSSIPPNAGDCRLLSRRVVQALRQLPERERFMKGLFNWVGFKSASVEFTRQQRSAGVTKWNYWKLWNFALQGITAGSTGLLRMWSYLGISISFISVLYALWVAFKKICYGDPVTGYASLMVALLFFSGIQLLSLGIIGEYLSRIFVETKQRPLYFIDEKINF